MDCMKVRVACSHQSTLLVTGPQKPAALCRRYNSGDSKVMSAGAMPCKRAAAAPSYSDSGGGQRASWLRSQDRAGFLDATANESFRKAAHRGAMVKQAQAGGTSQPASRLACQ